MKLLFDENLSPKLVEHLVDIYPHLAHVDRIGLGAQSNHEVWEYAQAHVAHVGCISEASYTIF